MPITANELNQIAEQAFETSLALEKSEEKAKASGQTALADDISETRGRLDDAMRNFWNNNKIALLDPRQMAAVSRDLGEAAAAARQAAKNLAGVATALNRISVVINRLLEIIRLARAF